MATRNIYLLNCRECDSFTTATDSTRTCLCGKASLREHGRELMYDGGPLRIWALSWEAYDGAQLHEAQRIRVIFESPRWRSSGKVPIE
jgi:hypothetical protein